LSSLSCAHAESNAVPAARLQSLLPPPSPRAVLTASSPCWPNGGRVREGCEGDSPTLCCCVWWWVCYGAISQATCNCYCYCVTWVQVSLSGLSATLLFHPLHRWAGLVAAGAAGICWQLFCLLIGVGPQLLQHTAALGPAASVPKCTQHMPRLLLARIVICRAGQLVAAAAAAAAAAAQPGSLPPTSFTEHVVGSHAAAWRMPCWHPAGCCCCSTTARPALLLLSKAAAGLPDRDPDAVSLQVIGQYSLCCPCMSCCSGLVAVEVGAVAV